MALIPLLLLSCKRDLSLQIEPSQVSGSSFLSTTEATGITHNTAQCGGTFNGKMAGYYSYYGVCWSVNPYPRLSDPFVIVSGVLPYDSYTFTCTISGLASNTKYHARAFAVSQQDTVYGNTVWFISHGLTVQQRLDTGETPLHIYNSGYPVDSLYGKNYKNGLIFYLNTTNGTGYIASKATDNDKSWGNEGYDITGTCAGLGCGNDNTNKIVTFGNNVGSSYWAAFVCRTSPSNTGWYLPSKDELNKMFHNLKQRGFGNFTYNTYWSSTQFNVLNAWCQDFDIGTQQYKRKTTDEIGVRCISNF